MGCGALEFRHIFGDLVSLDGAVNESHNNFTQQNALVQLFQLPISLSVLQHRHIRLVFDADPGP